MKLTDFQEKYISLMRKHGSMTVQQAAWKMKTSRVAVAQSGYSLVRKGVCGSYRSGNDRWAALVFYLID